MPVGVGVGRAVSGSSREYCVTKGTKPVITHALCRWSVMQRVIVMFTTASPAPTWCLGQSRNVINVLSEDVREVKLKRKLER